MTEASSSTITKSRLIPKKPEGVSFLAFGDSLTEGYTDFGIRFHPYGWALKSHLQKLHPELKNITVDVEGQSGDCVLRSLSGQFQRRLRAAAPEGRTKYDLIIILGGTNDLGHYLGRGLEGAREIFDEGLKVLYEYVLEKTSAGLLVMTVPERAIDRKDSSLAKKARAAREHLNDLIKRWAGGTKERVYLLDLAPLVPFLDARSEDPPKESMWSPDGLHMSDVGYDFVGETLATFIHELLNEKADE